MSQPALSTAYPTHLCVSPQWPTGAMLLRVGGLLLKPQGCPWGPVSSCSLVETKQVFGWMCEWNVCETEASGTIPVWSLWRTWLESRSAVLARVTPAIRGLALSPSWLPVGKLSHLCPTWSHSHLYRGLAVAPLVAVRSWQLLLVEGLHPSGQWLFDCLGSCYTKESFLEDPIRCSWGS